MAVLRYVSIFVLLFGCTSSMPTFEGIDLALWRNDKFGCGHVRSATLEKFDAQKTKLHGLSEMDIMDLLGRPDETELYTRNQKFYYYYLEPGSHCSSGRTARRLSVRFNATGFAKEISIEEYSAEQQKTASK